MKFLAFGFMILSSLAFAGPCQERCRSEYNRCNLFCDPGSPTPCPTMCSRQYYACLAQCAPPAPVIALGSKVEIVRDSKLYIGTLEVGEVKLGEQYLLAAIQNNWASLKLADGTPVKGWIQLGNIKVVK